MCGIVGYVQTELNRNDATATIQAMADVMSHRGPDDSGIWLDEKDGVVLGHRRLAIVDLTAAGHQPMCSASRRYTIVYNGEIYNHLEIRRELQNKNFNIQWNGHSDTETLLAGFDIWGIQDTVKKTRGMFTFAVWDSDEQALILGRDRLGEKPLYYGWQGNTFLFGSELKSLKAYPQFENVIDRQALSLYLRFNYVPTPYTIYKGIKKLQAGSLLILKKNNREPVVTQYWSLATSILEAKSNGFQGSAKDVVNTLEIKLRSVIQQQMMADVPLGVFLSGGVDSSVIAALMQELSDKPVSTFSIGFENDEFNEAEYAKAVALHIGTDHTELYVTADMAIDIIPKLPQLYDEPFADSSQIVTFLLSRLAKQKVTVALTGDGGDELFCGYNRYVVTEKLWRKISRIPSSARHIAARLLTVLSPVSWDRIFKYLPSSKNWTQIGNKIHKGAAVLSANSLEELYLGLISQWQDPGSVVINGSEPDLNIAQFEKFKLSNVESMMALDTVNYLADDILVKVDRAAMGVSLETRVPMLDHEIVQFAWSLPFGLKYRQGISKWPLRQISYKYLPKNLIERPKAGFAIPLDEWLRGPLFDWANSLLNESRLESEGFFHPQEILKKWHEHISGKRNWSCQLWSILMFQAWLEEHGDVL